jgi:hypothetical protein
MTPTFAIAGKLTREYLLPPTGTPLLDAPGGNLLYTAGGLAVWDSSIGLIARVNEDYPHEWLGELEHRGFDIRGIRIHPELGQADLRSFIAYTDKNERSHSSAVSHFARRQLTFPKALLGYQSPMKFAKICATPTRLLPPHWMYQRIRDVRHISHLSL